MELARVSGVALALALALAATSLAAAQTEAQAPKAAPKPAPTAQATDRVAALPPAIHAAFQKAYPKATIKNASKETEDGKTAWEVESLDNGLARDLVYSPDGTVIEIEEQIEPATLPAAVSAALKAKYPKATITKAEKMTKGTTLTYEIALKDAAVKSIEITPDGKIVPAAKKEKKEKEEKEDAPGKK